MNKKSLSNNLSKRSNGFYLSIFLLLFSIALIISLVLRGVQLYKDSHFTGDSIMMLVVLSSDSYILRLDTDTQELSLLRIYDTEIDAKNLTVASIRTGVPLQGAMVLGESESDIDNITSTGGMIRLLMSNNISLIQLNEFDALKFAYAAQRIPPEQKTLKEIRNYIYDRSIISQIDHELYELFRDSKVINERVTIEVVNASDTSGTATAVAQMLENGGYTVVAIRSGDTQASQLQMNDKETVTAQHIMKVFAFPVENLGKNAVADIRVIIGDDTVQ